jgi:peptidoglycan/xylan/chitin deacetylase (PgdA/CDA1 family)
VHRTTLPSRREFLATSVAALTVGAGERGINAAANRASEEEQDAPALIAITLDLEMSRNFPTRETTHWDFEKGNLNAETKAYAVEAARRVKARGGRLHFFVVGRVLEQENVEWLKALAADGHPLGNHTYDHVNVTATKPEDIQFRFQRSPWLIEGQKPADVIRENIRLASAAMKSRLSVESAGFRTPGGFSMGLEGREDIQRMLLDLGFKWCSGKYPGHANTAPKENEPPIEPSDEIIASIVAAQAKAQPFTYPTGLIEVPMSPISDIGAFRTGRWKLEWFLKAIRAGVTWAIDNRACYDFLGHPSCLYVTDPEFQTIDLICDLVERAGAKAKLADLETLSRRARRT